MDVVVADLVSVKSSRKVLTYANGDNTMYMDHLFICRPDPNGNTEPFVGDEESLNVGWFSLMLCPNRWQPPRWNAWATCMTISGTRRTETLTPSSPSVARSAD